jgi:hypothetical protein
VWFRRPESRSLPSSCSVRQVGRHPAPESPVRGLRVEVAAWRAGLGVMRSVMPKRTPSVMRSVMPSVRESTPLWRVPVSEGSAKTIASLMRVRTSLEPVGLALASSCPGLRRARRCGDCLWARRGRHSLPCGRFRRPHTMTLPLGRVRRRRSQHPPLSLRSASAAAAVTVQAAAGKPNSRPRTQQSGT